MDAVTPRAVDQAIARIGLRTARGPDGIPAGLVRCLGEKAQEIRATILTGIIEGDPVPSDWLSSQVCLIPKKGGDASFLRNYRPLDGDQCDKPHLRSSGEGMDERLG